MSTVTRVQDLPDNRVALALDEVYNSVFEAVSYTDVLANARDTDALADLTSLPPARTEARLAGSDVVGPARELLSAMAKDPALEPFVSDACDAVEESDEMLVGTMIVAGALINLTYLVMATKVVVTRDADGKTKVSVKKGEASPEFIGTMVGNVLSVLKTV